MTDVLLPSAVQFSVRTTHGSSLTEVASRVERMLDLSLTPYEGEYFDFPVLHTSVLGLWIVVGQVQSLKPDAPIRFQLQARQGLDDEEMCEVIHNISDYILRMLSRHEPGLWYRPSKQEIRVDVGLSE